MPVFSSDASMFFVVFLFWPQKVEKNTLKRSSELLKKISPIGAQTEDFIFQNVAYRETVNRTGAVSVLCQE